MIVNFKIFELTADLYNYKHLSVDEEEEFSKYIIPEINHYFDEKIPKITIGKFADNNYNYRAVLDGIFDIFFFKRMYSYARNNITNSSTPEIHNSFVKILDNVIKDNKDVYMKIEHRLVWIYEKRPLLYKNHIGVYGDKIPSTVKDKLQYIIDSEKYNL